MNVAVRHRIMRIEDFLAWEARQEMKYEFDGIEPVAMAGGTFRHAAIQSNLAISIGGRLRGARCTFVGSDLKVVSGGRVRYPDGQVVCGKQEGTATFTTMPTVLFEVVSLSDRDKDHVEKAGEYCALASVQRYVILEQDRMVATVRARTGEEWSVTEISGGGVLSMPEIGIEVPLAELYEGVEFG